MEKIKIREIRQKPIKKEERKIVIMKLMK